MLFVVKTTWNKAHSILFYSILLNRLFRRRSKKEPKLRVTGLCEGNSPVTGEFPYKGPVTQKMFSFDGVVMISGWLGQFNHCCSPGSLGVQASATMLFIMQNKLIIVFCDEVFQLPVSFQCPQMMTKWYYIILNMIKIHFATHNESTMATITDHQILQVPL